MVELASSLTVHGPTPVNSPSSLLAPGPLIQVRGRHDGSDVNSYPFIQRITGSLVGSFRLSKHPCFVKLAILRGRWLQLTKEH